MRERHFTFPEFFTLCHAQLIALLMNLPHYNLYIQCVYICIYICIYIYVQMFANVFVFCVRVNIIIQIMGQFHGTIFVSGLTAHQHN